MMKTESATDENNGVDTTTKTSVGEDDYENPWYYQGTAFTSNDIGDFFGYVYCITNTITGKNISEESILHSVESLEVGNAKLRLRVTGKSTTEVLKNLKTTLKSLDAQFSEEK